MIYIRESGYNKTLTAKTAAVRIVTDLIEGGFGDTPEQMTAYSWAINSQTGHDISVNDDFTQADQERVNRHVMRLWAKKHDLDDEWNKYWRV
jgi:hypothetical protein